MLKAIKEKEDKLRAIYELSGGNPRLIISLYHIMTEVEITSAEETFQRMLDEMTPYFSARMKDLSPQQREIMDVIAQAEHLLTPTEIASRCGLPVNQVNAQIKRLEEMGYLEKVTGRKRKGVLYDVKERLFSLWRQMRVKAGRRRLSFIIRFLEIWFSRKELHKYIDTSLARMKECLKTSPEKLEKELDRLWYLKEATPKFKGMEEELIMIVKGKPELALNILEDKIKKEPDNSKTWVLISIVYEKMGMHKKAQEVLIKAAGLSPKDPIAWYKFMIVYLKQFANSSMKGRNNKAIYHLKDALRCIENAGGEDKVFDLFVSAFKEFVKKGKVDILKNALEEIYKSPYKNLKNGLSPFNVLVKYLDTKNETLLQRLKQEERLIVNEMLKAVEGKKKGRKKKR